MNPKYKKPYKARRKRYNTKAKRAAAQLAPSTATAVKKIVKSEMNKVIETKFIDNFVQPIPLSALYHNVPFTLENDLLFCTQGITDDDAVTSNRLGDSIYVKNVMIHLMLTAFSTRPNTVFRVTVVKTKSGLSTLTNPWQHPNCNNIILCPVDKELTDIVRVVYDRVFYQPQNGPGTQGDSGQDKKHIVKINIPVYRKVKYNDNAGNCASHSYKVFLGAYDTQGSSTLDNVARFSMMRRTFFLDA